MSIIQRSCQEVHKIVKIGTFKQHAVNFNLDQIRATGLIRLLNFIFVRFLHRRQENTYYGEKCD